MIRRQIGYHVDVHALRHIWSFTTNWLPLLTHRTLQQIMNTIRRGTQFVVKDHVVLKQIFPITTQFGCPHCLLGGSGITPAPRSWLCWSCFLICISMHLILYPAKVLHQRAKFQEQAAVVLLLAHSSLISSLSPSLNRANIFLKSLKSARCNSNLHRLNFMFSKRKINEKGQKVKR